MFKAIGYNIVSLGLILIVTGCTPPSPYAKGKSASDIPAHVDVIALKEVAMAYGQEKNGDPKPDANPSENDREVTVVVRRNIVSQLTNYGFKIVENPQEKADVGLRFYIGYMPERWPLVGRLASVVGIIDDTDGTTLFKTSAMKQNSTGLIGAMVGPSRDEMVSEVARETVIKIVTEMRKGTKNNTPVTAAVAPVTTPYATPVPPPMAAPQPVNR